MLFRSASYRSSTVILQNAMRSFRIRAVQISFSLSPKWTMNTIDKSQNERLGTRFKGIISSPRYSFSYSGYGDTQASYNTGKCDHSSGRWQAPPYGIVRPTMFPGAPSPHSETFPLQSPAAPGLVLENHSLCKRRLRYPVHSRL